MNHHPLISYIAEKVVGGRVVRPWRLFPRVLRDIFHSKGDSEWSPRWSLSGPRRFGGPAAMGIETDNTKLDASIRSADEEYLVRGRTGRGPF